MKMTVTVFIEAPGEVSRTRMEISVPQDKTARVVADGVMSALKSEQMRKSGDLFGCLR
jgi:hypothetical protein